MKKLIFLLVGLVLFSCSSSDESLENYQEAIAIESVILPTDFMTDETYEITVTYLRPTTCHAFNDIVYLKHNDQRVVHVIGTVFINNGNCTELNTELEASFNFKETVAGTYILKFWQGKDDNGEDIYLTEEITVVE
ncbi:hypothetical protein [Lacinutrix jangbogonensis]|uniref:hypothetical protein n=1 Tax=Lacinutrix jangbogonensis TaxID=1469557 RepID=UPI00053EB1BE|nr:hypothetical protein [Lacinutrix jangbogonensis]